jgi:hypothetical protein
MIGTGKTAMATARGRTFPSASISASQVAVALEPLDRDVPGRELHPVHGAEGQLCRHRAPSSRTYMCRRSPKPSLRKNCPCAAV